MRPAIKALKTAITRSITVAGNFIRAKDGGVLVFWSLALIPTLLAVGVAVDLSRAYVVKQRLSFALDAGGLAAASITGTLAERQAVLDSYFVANYPSDGLGTPGTPTITQNGDVFTVTADATVGTTFMGLAGFTDLNVAGSSEITRETRGLDLVLVLDNTGSMRSGNKIGALRQASLSLVDILYGSETTIPNLHIGVVPYSAAVNVGADAPNLVTGVHQGQYDPSNGEKWKGCVKSRAYPKDTDDSTMTGGNKWTVYWWDTAADNVWPPVNNSAAAANSGTGPNLGCPTPITAMTNVKAPVVAALTAMEAWSRGGTFSNVGMVWGWRVISPDAPFTEGVAYGTPQYDKVVILMTDGVNGYYKLPGSPFTSDYSAYERLSAGNLGTTNKSTAKTILNNRLVETCNNMKAVGLVIYTITFQLSNATTQQIYRDCATDPTKYFDSPSQADLEDNFKKIADELRRLRVSR